MQDPAAAFQPMKAQFPEQEQLKCPRCDSTNTKFCYYNNYNLSQPRHFCKNCRRYWTKGGALRNIPVGGGSRKNTKRSSNPKRSSSSSSTSTTSLIHNPDSQPDPARTYISPADHDRRILDIPGSFSSLLTSNGQFGGLLEGMNHSGSGMNSGPEMNADSGRSIGVDVQSNGNSESYWSGGNGWPDLAIYTPGSSFQ